jgi:hypothetical protein
MPSNGLIKSLERKSRRYKGQLRSVTESTDEHGVIEYLRGHNLFNNLALKYDLGIVLDPLPGDERFTGMLVIPYLTRNGVRAIKFRNLHHSDGDGAKFAVATGQKPRLYNTAAYFDAQEVIGIAEGEVDAINATEFLRLPTMGIPGAEMWHSNSRIWGPVFKDFSAVVMFTDGDKAGRELAKDVGETVGWRLKIVECPEGLDASEMINAGRATELIDKWQLATKEDEDVSDD